MPVCVCGCRGLSLKQGVLGTGRVHVSKRRYGSMPVCVCGCREVSLHAGTLSKTFLGRVNVSKRRCRSMPVCVCGCREVSLYDMPVHLARRSQEQDELT